MGMLDDDLAAILSDAIDLEMGDSATYTYQGGSTVSVTCAVQEFSEPDLDDYGSEIRRREADIVLRRSLVTAPVKGDSIVFASGPYTGTWVLIIVGEADEGAWRLRFRFDTRKKDRAANYERQP